MFRRSAQSLFALSLILVLSHSCLAAPIEAIPDEAIALIKIRRPAGLVKKLTTVATKIDKEYEEQVSELSDTLGAYIGNPNALENAKTSGVDPNGDWWLAMMEGNAGVTFVYGIPFKDKEETMKNAIGGGYHFVKHEKYLFYTTDGGISSEIQSRVDDEGKSISTVIDRASMALINKSDIAIYVNIKKVTARYKDQLDVISEELDKALADWKTLAPTVEGTDLGPLFQMYGDAAKTILQGVRDCEGYTAAAEVTFKGATIEQHLKIASGSPTDKLLQSQKTSELKDLEKLPAGQILYFAMHGDFAALTQWGYKFAAELLKDEAAKKSMREVADVQAQMTYGGYLMSLDIGDPAEGAMRSTVVTIAGPVDKLRDVTRKSASLFSAISAGGISQKIEFKAEAEKVGTYTADVMTVRTDADASKLPAPVLDALKKSTLAMYGPDGMTQRMVYLGDRMVITMGGGPKAMEAAIAAQTRSPLTTDKGNSPFEMTRKAVADKANLVALIDVPRLVARYAKVLAEIAPAAGEVERIKDLEFKPSFLGVSVTIGAGSIASTMYIPVEQASGLSELLKPQLPSIMETIQSVGGLSGPSGDSTPSPSKSRHKKD